METKTKGKKEKKTLHPRFHAGFAVDSTKVAVTTKTTAMYPLGIPIFS
jgi:hypothetical protein